MMQVFRSGKLPLEKQRLTKPLDCEEAAAGVVDTARPRDTIGKRSRLSCVRSLSELEE